MVDKITRRILYHIYAILLALNDFPLERINVFCQGHLTTLRLDPITPEKQAMIDAILLVYNPYDEGLVSKKTDKKKITTDVSRIKELTPYIKSEIADLQSKINIITHTDKNINKELGLNKPSSFYNNKNQHELLETYKSFKLNMSLNPLFAPLMVQANLFVKTVTDSYGLKNSKKSGVKVEGTDVKTMIEPLRKVLTTNFYALGTEYIDNPEMVADYFPSIAMDSKIKAKDFLRVNQWFVELMDMEIKNEPSIVFTFKSWMKVQNHSLGDVRVFLSSDPNPAIIPSRAQLVTAGSTMYFPFENIGSATELYLIFAAITPGQDVILKVTVDKTKK